MKKEWLLNVYCRNPIIILVMDFVPILTVAEEEDEGGEHS
jgi:hypothetical protein